MPSNTAVAKLKPLYFLPQDDLAGEALIPAFSWAGKVDCMMGFFSSDALAELAPGLATFLRQGSEPLRLIVSPYLSAEDQQAIEDGQEHLEAVARRAVEVLLYSEHYIAQHAARCLSLLLRADRLDLRIGLLKNGLFHPKTWIFSQKENVLAIHGSGNMTPSGIRRNYEQVSVAKSWEGGAQLAVVYGLRDQFRVLWEDRDPNCRVIPAAEALKQHLLQLHNGEPPREEDLSRHYARLPQREDQVSESLEPSYDRPSIQMPPGFGIDRVQISPSYSSPGFLIPSHLCYTSGPYAYQGEAVMAWCRAGFRGVLEMATGSGKTITAMIAAHRLHQQHQPLLIVVAAPYLPLIQQWCSEMEPFGLQPVNLSMAGDRAARNRNLLQLERQLRYEITRVEALVVSHQTLCDAEFLGLLQRFKCARLLIADEAHNLGRESFIRAPPTFFEHRLALSATPVRQYDDQGTAALFDYFGPVVFRFALKEAIGRCLVEYDYHVHPVQLTDEEMELWSRLSAEIRKNSWRLEQGDEDRKLEMLLRKRRKLLETAEGKIRQLDLLLDQEDLRSLRHTLIYATDKEPRQLDEVNALLKRRSLLFHQLTSAETRDRKKTRRIIQAFQSGELKVITSKRVLDEGVNIPQICKAFILASTTVGRQWVQRRGRVLRVCPAIGKAYSVIHDFVAVPPMNSELDRDTRKLISSELRRALEFASLARNAGKQDGPWAVIQPLADAAYLGEGEL